MRKMMMAIAALALSSGVAWGQNATQPVKLDATVDGYCTINNSVSGTQITKEIPVTNGKASGTALETISISNVTCTSLPKLKLISANGGLSGGSLEGLPINFVNKIHYTAKATYAGEFVELTSSAADSTTVGVTSATPISSGQQTGASITLLITPVPTSSGNLLRTGGYTDTLHLTIGPNP
jgi:hypothetical protein